VVGTRMVIALGAIGVLATGLNFSRLRTHSPHARHST